MKRYTGIVAFLCFLAFSKCLLTEPASAQNISGSTDSIKIGLLISESNYRDARCGAELAIKEAKKQKLLGGKSVGLVTRSMEGPWGTGASQTVDLVFNQKVWAIIGSHDGRNAHLAEQVIAKTQVVYVSAWAGDPTLAQAYVPWFFSLVPSNIQQAKALYTEIYPASPRRVVLLSDSTYDAENAIKYFIQQVKEHSGTEPVIIRYKQYNPDLSRLVTNIERNKPDALVLFGQPGESRSIAKLLQNASVQKRIFWAFNSIGEDPLAAFDPSVFSLNNIPDMHYMNSAEGKQFIQNFQNEFGKLPSPTAVYAYDALWIVLKNISNSGNDRDKFRTLMRTTDENGLTGTIKFDKLGIRNQKLEWVQVQ